MREGQVSRTSLKIARMGVYYGQHPDFRDLCPPGLAETNRRLLRAVDLLPEVADRVYASPRFDQLIAATDRWLAPGANTHFPLRKRFVDDQVREAVAAGCEQLLVVGAGLDSLAVRLVHDLDLLAVEVDHPATGSVKGRAVVAAELGHERLELVQADLAEVPLAEALAQSSWDAARPSVAVAEGLLMYLPDEAVRGLFRALHQATAPGSRFVFTSLRAGAEGPLMTGWIRGLIAAGGEPLRWWVEDDALEGFVAELGWRLLPPVDLRATYLAGTPLAEAGMTDWEGLWVAERAP